MNVKKWLSGVDKTMEKALPTLKTSKWFLLLGMVGVLLLLLSECTPKSNPSTPSATSSVQSTAEDYVKNMEQRLKQMIEQIDGAGKSEVMLTLQNSGESIYATQTKNSEDHTEDIGEGNSKKTSKSELEQETLIYEGTDGKQALLITQKEPQINGVIVACEGGENAVVQARIIQAVTTVLNLSTNRVCVTKISK